MVFRLQAALKMAGLDWFLKWGGANAAVPTIRRLCDGVRTREEEGQWRGRHLHFKCYPNHNFGSFGTQGRS